MIFGVSLNKRGYYQPTSVFVAVFFLAMITFALIDGVGLKDAGMLAFPLFMLYLAFLFDKRAALAGAILSMGSVTLIYIMGEQGMLRKLEVDNNIQWKVMLILLLAGGAFLWAVIGSRERIEQNLKNTYVLTLQGWAKALEFRDGETEGHSQRVIELTLELAKYLGISAEELSHMRRGALLHDIGKMAVPDAVLLKPGPLTDEEWVIMKIHPVKAKEFLEGVPFLQPALDIPYSHHERWDGSGYPEGLANEEIPFPARIFAVIDVWDALSSDRPYRKAWPREKVLSYLQEQAGKEFDPKVVDAFLDLVG